MKLKPAFLSFFLLTAAVFATWAQALPPDEAGALPALTASTRHGEWVTIDSANNDKVELWVVYPERKDPAPVVLVIHEIFGLTDWARAVADNLAAQGFIAIAPDFVSGKGPSGGGTKSMTVEQARAAIGQLKPAEILARLDAAATYGTSLPAATKNFGVVGFCWGGGISFSYATAQPLLKAAVVYYGTSPSVQSLSTVQAPVLGLYGGNDARVNATVPAAETELKRLGKRFESAFYEGAGHAFLRQLAAQNGANLKAANQAWPRTVSFLKELLETTPVALIPSAAGFEVSDAYCEDEECLPESAPGSLAALSAPLSAPISAVAVHGSH